MNAQNQQQLQNAQAQQALANIDASNLPPAQRNLLKNAVAQAHMINSMALHFVEHNNNGLLSPLANIGTTININFSNLNQAVNLGVALPTNLGKMWALRIGPFSSLLRLDQVIAVQQIPKDTLPVNIKVQGIDNVISQISERRGVAACFQGACGGSNLQCIWLEVPLNGPETPGVHGAVIVCRTHAPSFQGNEVGRITNPPFSQKKAVLEKLLKDGKPFVMIMPVSVVCTLSLFKKDHATESNSYATVQQLKAI